MKWFLPCIVPGILGSIISHEWVVRQEKMSPGNHIINGITINGQFPGPTIECEAGDVIKVLVHNELNRDFTIHWHGIKQSNSYLQDGTPYVSQLPIPSRGKFTYEFKVGDQPGTYFYHAHTGCDSELAFGGLIVKDNPKIWKDVVEYDSRYENDSGCDETIILSEMWNKDSQQTCYDLTNLPLKFSMIPDSILLNGRGFKDWSNRTANMNFNLGRYTVNIKPNKKCRLRFIGASGHNILGVTIPGHKLTVIEADGTLVEPLEIDHIEIDSGQRYSVIIETDKPINNYYIHTQIIPNEEIITKKVKLPSEVGFLHYENAPEINHLIKTNNLLDSLPGNLSFTRWINPILTSSKWYDRKLSGHYYAPPIKVDRDIYLEVHSEHDSTGLSVFTVNHQLLQPRDFPLFLNTSMNKIRQAIPGVYEINEGESIQLVFQQFAGPNQPCAQHPWHLHGHSFHVVGQGGGIYNPTQDKLKIDATLSSDNQSNTKPIFRDTFTQYPSDTSPSLGITPSITSNNETNCGWVAFRFIANNPGSWILHCHYTNHMVMGKLVTIVEHPFSSLL